MTTTENLTATERARLRALSSVEVTNVIFKIGTDSYEFFEKVGEQAVAVPEPRATLLAELLNEGLIKTGESRGRTYSITFAHKTVEVTEDGMATLYPHTATELPVSAYAELRKFGLPARFPTATDVVDALGRQASKLVLDPGQNEVLDLDRFIRLHTRTVARLLDTFMVHLTTTNPELAARLRAEFAEQQDARAAAGEA